MRGIIRTTNEIDDVQHRAAESSSEGRSVYPGMSYEEGIDAVLRWLFDEDADAPFDEE